MIRVDLHMHTWFSGDATISPKLIVEELHAHSFIKGVAITDHDTLQGYFHARKLAVAYEDILVIPGIEVTTQQGHISILGIEEKPVPPSSVESVVDFARERDGTIIIPHPYRELGLGDTARNIQADAVEVLNAYSTNKENKMAQELAKAKNLPGVAGSDAHFPEYMWAAYTEIKAEPNVNDILKAIKKGLVKVASEKPGKAII